METIDSMKNALQIVVDKLDNLNKKIDAKNSPNPLNQTWLDIQDTCLLLKISKRTLQSYRDNGILPFSQIGGKIYFRANDIEEHLNRHYNKAFNKR